MSIFSKPLTQLDATDLQELILNGAVENVRLEFKSEVPHKDETLKKLSSFANTFGGFLVVGAKANSADGRVQDLVGVEEQPGYRQKLVQWSFDACSPPLIVEVSDPIPTPSGNGKFCYVIYTPESDATPHFLNGRKGIWVRTDEFSAKFEARLADERELRHLLDRRRLIRERRSNLIARAAKRFEAFSRTRLGEEKAKCATRLNFSLIPRFPARQLYEQHELKSLNEPQGNWIPWQHVLFPDLSIRGISQHESLIVPNAAGELSFLETNIWGLHFYGVRADKEYGIGPAISLLGVVGHILLFLRHAGIGIQRMGYSGPLHLEVSFGPLRGVSWIRQTRTNPAGAELAGSEFDDELVFSLSPTSQDVIERLDGVAMDVLRTILFAVGASNLVESQQRLESLILDGYAFNLWDEPESLKL